SGASTETTPPEPSGQGSIGPSSRGQRDSSDARLSLNAREQSPIVIKRDAWPRGCEDFLHDHQGRTLGAPDLRPTRSGLDKATIAAAVIGLGRAGQRQPDRRTAYGPPPLVKSAALFARGCREPVVQAARRRRDDDHQGAGLGGEVKGDGLRRGASAK